VYHGAKSSNKVMLPREVSQNVKMDINVPGTWIQSGKNGEFSDFDSSLAGTLNGIIVTLNELNELDELTQKQKNGEFSTDDLTRLTELQGKNLNQSLGGELLGQVDDHIDNMLSIRSELGAKANRLDAAKKKNDEETFNMTKLLSKTEDIDFAEKIMQYMMMSNVYEASLSTGAKILQPTILDFLK
jgi:flagellar hook-associated protein 3 FlgL